MPRSEPIGGGSMPRSASACEHVGEPVAEDRAGQAEEHVRVAHLGRARAGPTRTRASASAGIGVSSRSTSVTRWPARASASAEPRPPMPAPTTTTSSAVHQLAARPLRSRWPGRAPVSSSWRRTTSPLTIVAR